MSPSRTMPVRIIIDVHERQSGIGATLSELGAEIEVAPLPAGDRAVGADTLVERKRVRDLHAAILKGRLRPQLGKLRTPRARSPAEALLASVPGISSGIGPERARALEATFHLRRDPRIAADDRLPPLTPADLSE